MEKNADYHKELDLIAEKVLIAGVEEIMEIGINYSFKRFNVYLAKNNDAEKPCNAQNNCCAYIPLGANISNAMEECEEIFNGFLSQKNDLLKELFN
jgi:hypothetical protein